ncbi:ATP-binding protein [Candidatus Pacearchaeota archaeon]|nr:ATP-binding protein [Candidatus Pacearchaeota archaeon]
MNEAIRSLQELKCSNYYAMLPKSMQNKSFVNFDFTNNEEVAESLFDFIVGDKKENIILHGDFATGKTHLLCSLFKVLLAEYSRIDKVYFITFLDFDDTISKFLETKDSISEFIGFLSNVDYLLVDDVFCVDISKFSEKEFVKVIDYRFYNEKPIIITLNLLDKLKERLSAHATSRILGSAKLIKVNNFSNEIRR